MTAGMHVETVSIEVKGCCGYKYYWNIVGKVGKKG